MPESDRPPLPRPPRPLRLVGVAGELVPVRREPAPPSPPAIPALPSVALHDLYGALLADARAFNTRESRRHDVELFRRWLTLPTPAAACAAFISAGRGQANAIGLAFRAHELGRGQAPSSVNRRLAMLRKLVVLARRFDLIDRVVDLPDVPNRAKPDRRGPGLEGWRSLWAAAVDAGDGAVARRDRAILLLMRDSALRKGEVVALDCPDDFDPDRPAVNVVGKGADRKGWVTVNHQTAAALAEWLDARGAEPGPMFLAKRRAASARLSGRRVGERTVNLMVKNLARRAGIATPVRPHGLRHAGITRALDLTNGDIRKVARFARHANPKTTIAYDDDRTDLAGVVARMLGDDD